MLKVQLNGRYVVTQSQFDLMDLSLLYFHFNIRYFCYLYNRNSLNAVHGNVMSSKFGAVCPS